MDLSNWREWDIPFSLNRLISVDQFCLHTCISYECMQRRPRRDCTNAISRKNIASNINYVNFPNITAHQTLFRTTKVHARIPDYLTLFRATKAHTRLYTSTCIRNWQSKIIVDTRIFFFSFILFKCPKIRLHKYYPGRVQRAQTRLHMRSYSQEHLLR